LETNKAKPWKIELTKIRSNFDDAQKQCQKINGSIIMFDPVDDKKDEFFDMLDAAFKDWKMVVGSSNGLLVFNSR